MNYFDSFDLRQITNLELFARQVVEGFIIGLHKSPFHGFSVEFAEHRLYNQGESTKNLDWKVYARTDRLFVKKYEEETNLRCQIIIDASSSMYFPNHKDIDPGKPNKLQFASLAAAALMHLLKKQRDAFGLSVFHNELVHHTRARLTTKHYNLLLGFLDELIHKPTLNIQTDLSRHLHQIAETMHRRSLAVIFSDMIDEEHTQDEVFSALQHLKYNKHEVILFHTVDKKHELDFDYEDRPMKFIDMETGAEVKLQSHQIKEYYTTKVAESVDTLKSKCLQYGIDYVEADINTGFYPVLYNYLVKRAKMM